MIMRTLFCATMAVVLAIGCSDVRAQANYPERPLRLLFGFPPGSDTNTRLIADKLSASLGKAVIFDNVSGASGGIAADRTAKAPPDGYTFGVHPIAAIVINNSLYAKLPYDPLRDLLPVTPIFEFPNILIVNNDVPAKSVEELVALARSNPGKLTFAHAGIGSTQHLAGELFKSRAAIDIQQVPYRGTTQMATDLIGGRISMSFLSPQAALPLINSGKVRPLAVTSRSRAPFAPELPTMIELGFADFEFTPWFGVFVPAGTPSAIVERLNTEIVRIIALPDVRTALLNSGVVPLSSTPDEFGARIKTEAPFWAKFIKELGVQAIE